jgi:hypothetical protein
MPARRSLRVLLVLRVRIAEDGDLGNAPFIDGEDLEAVAVTLDELARVRYACELL